MKFFTNTLSRQPDEAHMTQAFNGFRTLAANKIWPDQIKFFPDQFSSLEEALDFGSKNATLDCVAACKSEINLRGQDELVWVVVSLVEDVRV